MRRHYVMSALLLAVMACRGTETQTPPTPVSAPSTRGAALRDEPPPPPSHRLYISTETLPEAHEAVDYQAPLLATGGNGPLSWTLSAGTLPAGLSLSSEGLLSGQPAASGAFVFTVQVTDGAQRVRRELRLDVHPARPIPGGGVAGRAPRGGPLRENLIVFLVGDAGRPLPGVGVRVRKNGVEYDPPRQALSDAQGKVVLTGLGLNGTTDTVDITANGRDLLNQTLAGVNASLVTLRMWERPLPFPRYGMVSAYDTDAQRMIVTSGFSALGKWGCINDVVELADAATHTWEQPVPTGMVDAMPTRLAAAGAYAGGALVVFGGSDCEDYSMSSDTWEYAPAARRWTRTSNPGPRPRNVPVMTADDTGERVLLFGGITTDDWNPSAELWRYTPALDTWEPLTPEGSVPEARYAAAAAFDTRRGEMVVCGGEGLAGELSDCHAYSPSRNAWRPLPSMPLPRRDFAMAYDPVLGELYVFGGKTQWRDQGDLLALRGDTWVTLTAQGVEGAPGPRYGHALQFDVKAGQLVLMGGASETDGTILDEVWTYAPATGQWRWRNPPPAPPGLLRISGTLSGGPVDSFFVQAMVVAVGSSGYSEVTWAYLQEGQGQYTLSAVPPGETVSLTAYLQDYPPMLLSYVRVDALGPVTEDQTLDLHFPPGPLPLLTRTFSFTVPESWTRVDSLIGQTYQRRPGHPQELNGLAVANRRERTLEYSTLPLSPGAVPRFQAYARSLAPSACAFARIYWEGERTGPLSFPEGPKGLSPGTSLCQGGTPPHVSEEQHALTLPEGTALWRATRGSYNMMVEWVYVGSGRQPSAAFRFPEPSTLAPSRPTPPGQYVGWEVEAALTSRDFHYDDFTWSSLRPDAWAGTLPYGYVRQ